MRPLCKRYFDDKRIKLKHRPRVIGIIGKMATFEEIKHKKALGLMNLQ